ncbi:TonB-dependent receptor plug domain-containing protein [Parvibaculum sp. MBR-TMA-1.3b-4.2]|jgi:vitamin B12 transporter
MHQTVFRRALLGATALACIALAMPAHAQENSDDSDQNTDGIVVTSTKIPTQIEKTGSSISVVTKEEMEEQQTRQVLDVLTTTPGISVSQFGAKGTDSNVRMRGLPGQYTSVLIDGVEVSDPSRSQTAFDFSQLGTAGIDRIEVLRGSQSVLYGGEAVAGVVNIVTARGRGDFKSSVFGEVGSYDTYLVGGSTQGGFDDDRGGINVSAQYLDTGGFSAADENLPGNSEGEDYDNISSLGRLDYQLTDRIGIKGNFRYAQGTLNYDASSGSYGDDPDRGDDFLQYSGRGGVTFATQDRFFVGEAGVAYSYSKRDGFDNGTQSYYYIGDRVTYDVQGTLTFNPDNIVIVGAERNEESYESDSSPAGADVWTNSWFGMYQFSPVENLYLSAGARLDDHEAFGVYDTYRATAAYRFTSTGTTIRSSYSTGFRAPSLFELYGKCCGDPNFGNPDLKPEESKSWDAGIDQLFLNGDVLVSVTYFNIDTENAIKYSGTFGTPAPNYFNIAGESRSRGVEASADWMVTNDLRLNLAYTWNVVQDATGKRYDNAPRHDINFNANYVLLGGRANVNLNVLHTVDTRDSGNTVRLDDPFVVKLAARYRLFDNLDITARIENLLNDQYQTEYGYGTSDRAFYAGLKYRF